MHLFASKPGGWVLKGTFTSDSFPPPPSPFLVDRRGIPRNDSSFSFSLQHGYAAVPRAPLGYLPFPHSFNHSVDEEEDDDFYSMITFVHICSSVLERRLFCRYNIFLPGAVEGREATNGWMSGFVV